MKALSGLLAMVSCLLAFIAAPVVAADTPASPDAKIAALITQVENLKNAKFIRNGSEYDAKSAAKFLRGKWDSKKKEIQSPEAFITKVATSSGTTGQPYVIRFKDGKKTPCAAYLKEQLAKIDQSGKAAP